MKAMITTAILFWCLGIFLGIQAERLWPSKECKADQVVYVPNANHATVERIYYNRESGEDTFQAYNSVTDTYTIVATGYYGVIDRSGSDASGNYSAGTRLNAPKEVELVRSKK